MGCPSCQAGRHCFTCTCCEGHPAGTSDDMPARGGKSLKSVKGGKTTDKKKGGKQR